MIVVFFDVQRAITDPIRYAAFRCLQRRISSVTDQAPVVSSLTRSAVSIAFSRRILSFFLLRIDSSDFSSWHPIDLGETKRP